MEEENKKNKTSVITIVILCVLIIITICIVLNTKLNVGIKTSTGYGFSDCGVYKYKNLKVNGKKINFGLNKKVNVDNECWVSSVESYQQAKDFIVVKIYSTQWGYVGAGYSDTYYILDNNGKILKEINKLGNNSIYDSSFSIINNSIIIKAYPVSSIIPPDDDEETIKKITYKIEYLGNYEFSNPIEI